MKKLSFILIIILAVNPLFSQSFEVYKGDTINYTDFEGKKQGKWIYFDTNNYGKIIKEGIYVNNKKEGIWKSYYKNGNLKASITYKNNRQNGYAKIYYKNRIVSEEGIWKGNRWTGQYKYYHKNGKPAYIWNFDNEGRRTGHQQYFFENGNLRLEGNWEDGKEQGVIKEYYVTGKIKMRSEWKFGKTDGVLREYYENGTVKAEKVFNNGIYNPNASKVYAYKNNTNNNNQQDSVKVANNPNNNQADLFTGTGFHKIYNDKKQLIQEGNFSKGVLVNGKKYYYDENGKHIKTAVYEEGRITEVIDIVKEDNK